MTQADASPNGASEPLRVALAADHAGVHLKDELVLHLEKQGVAVTDLGTHGEERVDYPDFGLRSDAPSPKAPQTWVSQCAAPVWGCAWRQTRFTASAELRFTTCNSCFPS